MGAISGVEPCDRANHHAGGERKLTSRREQSVIFTVPLASVPQKAESAAKASQLPSPAPIAPNGNVNGNGSYAASRLS